MNVKQGMSFAQTLRSVLRQDPGALMVGEIRDRETAEIATQAGLTGHLIFTTIHVQSAAGTFARLIEMDVEPFILASSCAGSLAQRLVRGLCVECRSEAAPGPEELARFQRLGIRLPEATYYEPRGCSACDGRGYSGRLPIAEILMMSDALRAAVHERAPQEVIHRIAISEGMTPLVWSGLKLAMKGNTSLLEVLRVAG
jgi:type IV pilus assembly protein PilB